jgi:DNA-binding response OmpR family regulator
MEYNKSNGLILIVDDNVMNTQQIKDMLEIHGFQSITAKSASQGLEIVRTIKPELILLDIVMPEINGFSFCETVKSNQQYNDIPIIFMTAQTKSDSIDRAYKAGANDFIKKPVKPNELASRIKIQLRNAVEERERKEEIDNMRKQLITLREELHKAKNGDSEK